MLESLFNKVAGLRPAILLKRDSNTVVFCEIGDIFKITYFEVHLPTTASELMLSLYTIRSGHSCK